MEVQWYDSRDRQLRERIYKVDAIHIVNPEDVELLTPIENDALTLAPATHLAAAHGLREGTWFAPCQVICNWPIKKLDDEILA